MKSLPDRTVLHYRGHQRGPLIIIMGGVHGNEPAGIHALKEVQRMLDYEPEMNSEFRFCGQVVGLIGNLRAVSIGERYIDVDLNRSWLSHHLDRALGDEDDFLLSEEKEMREILSTIDQHIDTYKPEKIYLLDIHTTSAKAGLFTIVSDDPESRRIGMDMHAPVILGMIQGIQGTLMKHFTDSYRGIPVVTATFEGGQHREPKSVSRSVSAIINFLRSASAVYPHDVESKHDDLLAADTAYLPRLAELIYSHKILPDDGFRMKPGYRNFQPIYSGEHLADTIDGPVLAQYDGLILMPLYQRKGTDGYYIIKELESRASI